MFARSKSKKMLRLASAPFGSFRGSGAGASTVLTGSVAGGGGVGAGGAAAGAGAGAGASDLVEAQPAAARTTATANEKRAIRFWHDMVGPFLLKMQAARPIADARTACAISTLARTDRQ